MTISAELRGKVGKTELFGKTIKKTECEDYDEDDGEDYYEDDSTPETLGLVPDFVVAYSAEALKKQHSSFQFIDQIVIRNDTDKNIPLTENLSFSYSSSRNSYMVADGLQTKKPLYNWQNYAIGANDYKWQTLSNVGPKKEARSSIVCKENKRHSPTPLQWHFHAKGGVQVNRLLLFVNSDDNVIWTVEIHMPDNTQPISVQLTPGLEKTDKLYKTVHKIVIRAQVPHKGKIFDEDFLKNQVSMVVAVNESAEAYINRSLQSPSEQNLSKAMTIIPNENDIFEFKYSRLRPTEDGGLSRNDAHIINGVIGGTAKAFIENWDAFRFVDEGEVSDSNITGRLRYSKPLDMPEAKEHVALSWSFDNVYELPITEIYIYVNSMADYDTGDSESLKWKLSTNSYESNLVDKQSNVVKLISNEEENFHKQIVLKLEINPKKVDKFFATTQSAPQIRMKVKFNTRSKKFEAVRRVKWSEKLIGKIFVEQKSTDVSYLKRMKAKLSQVISKLKRKLTETETKPRTEINEPCCLIIAIDETKMFSQSGNSSIQPKLRRAVNELFVNLMKRLRYKDSESDDTKNGDLRYRDDVGIVVARFGGTDYEYDPKSDFNDGHKFAGPFKKQKVGQFDKSGTSIYEFVPRANAKFAEYYEEVEVEVDDEDGVEDEDEYEDEYPDESCDDAYEDTPLIFFQTWDSYINSDSLEKFDLFVSSLISFSQKIWPVLDLAKSKSSPFFTIRFLPQSTQPL